jgi:hypothetical protein
MLDGIGGPRATRFGSVAAIVEWLVAVGYGAGPKEFQGYVVILGGSQ